MKPLADLREEGALSRRRGGCSLPHDRSGEGDCRAFLRLTRIENRRRVIAAGNQTGWIWIGRLPWDCTGKIGQWEVGEDLIKCGR